MSSLNTDLLSIVIPVVNESAHIPGLLECLAQQRGADFEVVVADGGSTDGTPDKLLDLQPTLPFPLRVIETRRGRARQLNAAAAEARGEWLLFLHADSLFEGTDVLEAALEALKEAIGRAGTDRLAGHFPLRFIRSEEEPCLAYYYYEAKAALDRRGCTHGDQGFLLTRRFWQQIGPFDDTLPVLEDTFFADEVRRHGRWILLPGKILTSARRFEVEGLRPRQTLNALIMNFAAIGWDDFFQEATSVYRSQDAAGRLNLLPFLQLIRRLLRPLPAGRRLGLWYRTGRFVRPNAWQIAFFFDVRRAHRANAAAEQIDTPLLDRFEPLYEKTTDNIPGRFAAAVLVWIWFHLTFLACLLGEDR
ncbi:MAG: glycosyltransferase family 2 protein [Desulfuromonadales bacterium]|nr:glycosyltransferase family 2 protein [Desulfuromonadales bacterium]NIR34280.1 glycosyltransferase family 2 protein [Desulfuromonadales bacterium]NIS42858.1 glycosyltransferase family 2 protein [Desulfuromonadales bacterium]